MEKRETWWQANRHWLIGPVVGVGLLTGIVVFVLLVDFWRALGTTDDDQADVRNIGIVLIAIFGAGFAVWRGLIASEQNRVARDQYARSQDRDYADLFTKAVEQLGTTREIRSRDAEGNDVYTYEPNIEVRLGAIYALERISQDSERDHIAVMETLCAYVRENAPVEGEKEFKAPEREEGLEGRALGEWWQNVYRDALQDWIEALPRPEADIQAVLTVLGRRLAERVDFEIGDNEEEPRYQLDLRRTNLCKMNMRKGDFRNALFSGARMQGAYLEQAQIQGAYLRQVRMQGANLWEAQMQRAQFEQVRMQGSYVREAQMQGTDLRRAQIQAADLKRAQIQGSNLWQARMQGTNAEEARMQNANLGQARMQGADIRKSQIQGANLDQTWMQGTNLDTVIIDSVMASTANFTDASNLSQEAVDSCFGCAGTVLPKGLTRPRHWHPEKLDFSERGNAYEQWKTARAVGKRPPWVAEEDWTGW